MLVMTITEEEWDFTIKPIRKSGLPAKDRSFKQFSKQSTAWTQEIPRHGNHVSIVFTRDVTHIAVACLYYSMNEKARQSQDESYW
jgi:hypothetical protein